MRLCRPGAKTVRALPSCDPKGTVSLGKPPPAKKGKEEGRREGREGGEEKENSHLP